MCLLTVFKQSGVCLKNQDRIKLHSVTNRTPKVGPHVPEDSDLKCESGGSGLVKSTAQNVLYVAFITETKPVMTNWEIQVYKKRQQLEHISLYDTDYLEDARLCGTDHLKSTALYGRDQPPWIYNYGRDHLGDAS